MTILTISRNVPEAQRWLFSKMTWNATNAADTLVAALEIFSAESKSHEFQGDVILESAGNGVCEGWA